MIVLANLIAAVTIVAAVCLGWWLRDRTAAATVRDSTRQLEGLLELVRDAQDKGHLMRGVPPSFVVPKATVSPVEPERRETDGLDSLDLDDEDNGEDLAADLDKMLRRKAT